MKSTLYTAFFLISVLISCQKNTQENFKTKTLESNTNHYLNLQTRNNNILIGEFTHSDISPNENFEIIKSNDNNEIKLLKKYLETEDIDGKIIRINGHNTIRKIKITYSLSLFFNGTEKANIFIPLQLNISREISNNSEIPSLNSILKDKEFREFITKNEIRVKQLAYDNYINYYKKIPLEELRDCCVTDYNNFIKIKNINNKDIDKIDIEKDLAMYYDYEFLSITIPNTKLKINYYKKDESAKENENKFNDNDKIDWIGDYQITTKALSYYDKQPFDINYYISIDNEKSAILSIGAKHSEDYMCEGDYVLIKLNNKIQAKGKCDQDDTDDFYLKFENGKYYIKSKRFINQDWQELKKEQ